MSVTWVFPGAAVIGDQLVGTIFETMWDVSPGGRFHWMTNYEGVEMSGYSQTLAKAQADIEKAVSR